MIVKFDKLYGPYERKTSTGGWELKFYFRGERQHVEYFPTKDAGESRKATLLASIRNGCGEAHVGAGAATGGIADSDSAALLTSMAKSVIILAQGVSDKDGAALLKTKIMALQAAQGAMKFSEPATTSKADEEDLRGLSYEELVSRAERLIAEHRAAATAASPGE